MHLNLCFLEVCVIADGYIYHSKLNVLLGRNVSDVVEYLRNPLNEDVLKDLSTTCEKYWNT